MGLKVVTNFGVLMKKAHILGQARLYGTPEEIEKAEKEHNEYKELCLMSDEMSLGCTIGDINGKY